jgi:hypothetical protein
MTLYLPTIEHAPYFYCCRLEVNAFTCPSICNNAPFEDLFEASCLGSMELADLTMVIQTRWPFRDLYHSLFEWVLQSDYVGRIEVKPLIEAGTPVDSSWPGAQRVKLDGILTELAGRPFEAGTPFFRIDCPPFAPFEWTNEMEVRPEIQLARETLARLVQFVKPPQFLQLLAALLTEQPIVVMGNKVGPVSEAVLAMHLLLYPLTWQSPSASVLAPALFDLLDAPSSYLYGITEPSAPIPPTTVVLDLTDGSLTGPPLPVLPASEDLRVTLETHWENLAANEEEAVYLILDAVENMIKDLLYNAQRAIVTDYSSVHVKGSTFVPELWFATFKLQDRPFAAAMNETQLMQFYVQFECTKRSRAFAVLS